MTDAVRAAGLRKTYGTGASAVVALDDVSLTITLPDGLTDRIVAQIKRFTAT